MPHPQSTHSRSGSPIPDTPRAAIRSLLLLITSLIIPLPGCHAPHAVTLDSPKATPAAAPSPFDIDPRFFVKPLSPVIDCGDIPTFQSKTVAFSIINTDTEPHTLVSPRGNPRGLHPFKQTEIAPGGTFEFQLTMNGGVTAGPIKGKSVIILVEGQPDLRIPVRATAISYVEIEPGTIDLEASPSVRLTLHSIDDVPFHIVSIMPPIVKDVNPDARTRHELVIDRSLPLALPDPTRRFSVYLDHPKCQCVVAQLIDPRLADMIRATTQPASTHPISARGK